MKYYNITQFLHGMKKLKKKTTDKSEESHTNKTG